LVIALAWLLILLVTTAAIVVGFGLLVAPTMPRLRPLFGTAEHSRTNFALVPPRSDEPFVPLRNRHVPETARQAKRFAVVQGSDPSSVRSLRSNLAEIDAFIPDWLVLAGVDGSIKERYPLERRATRAWLSQRGATPEVYPSLSSPLPTAQIVLAHQVSRARLVHEIADFLELQSCQGIAVVLPDLPATSHGHLIAFLSELRRRLEGQQRKIIVVLPPKDRSRQAQELARVADYILVRTDQSPDQVEAGPIASQGWFETSLAEHLKSIDRAKLIVAIGSLAYDWDRLGNRQQLSVQEAFDIAARAGVTLEFDSRTLNVHFAYGDDRGSRHEVWALDAVSVFNLAKAALATQPAGIALWRLGTEEPSVWASIGRGRLPDQLALDALKRPKPGSSTHSALDGRVVDFEGTDAPGQRRLVYNPELGLLIGQSLIEPPRAAKLAALPMSSPRRIALTFDDGPDEKYTDAILDVLAAKGVKATFFVLGRNVIRNPNVLRRVYAEGHDIGNHTFSHPDLLQSSDGQIELELNATQRVLEAYLGIRSRLLRAPYASASFLSEADAPRVVKTAAGLGYLTATVAIDSFDWVGGTAAQIEERVVGGAELGAGQIVLLHDSGGNRAPTLAAVPVIIDRLRAMGFELVTLHELIGRSRLEMMPPVNMTALVGQAGREMRWAAIHTTTSVLTYLPVVAIGATVAGIARLTLIILAAAIHRLRQRRRAQKLWAPASICVLVPAFNEEKVIGKTIASLLASTATWYFDIIVIDDGSTDRTADAVGLEFRDVARIKLITQPNGGKASALNRGLRATDAEIVIAIDADTILDPSALERLVRHFEDPLIGAVAGRAIVGNRLNLITRFQALEYLTSQNLDRRAFELVNGIAVVPGAIGAWRRSAVLQAGGYGTDNMAEDADLTMALERRGWRVIYEPAAVARTEAPENVRAFLKQRFRWMFGTLQVAWKHSGAIWRGRPAGLAFGALPNIFVFQFVFTLLSPLMDAILLWAIATALVGWLSGSGLSYGDLGALGAFWLLFLAVDTAAAVVAFGMNADFADLPLLGLLPIQRFWYRQLLYLVAIQTLWAAVKGRLIGWGKLNRSGRVRSAAFEAHPPAPPAAVNQAATALVKRGDPFRYEA
jgi:cellulose synthase/poly-beta-1,6-N-acetylglucosamine synthase-like glycosyltransferase/peptidoglycan/xylan/chitin deacetylase (PgdA/CDA1 family)/spore germination protein YaaH